MTHPNRSDWIKASRSNNNGTCVEMCGPDDDSVAVRDTKHLGAGPELHMSRATFAAWLAGGKAGELDYLAEL